jgi:hypothetical protein
LARVVGDKTGDFGRRFFSLLSGKNRFQQSKSVLTGLEGSRRINGLNAISAAW